MNLLKKSLTAFSVFVLVLFQIIAQAPDEISVIPPSPTAASLGTYGEFPVSLYTGTPNINIPIYNIQVGDFSLPISLSYHASGIKVEQMSGWVGLGWSLNAGGVITRSVRGLNDIDSGYGYDRFGTSVMEDLATAGAFEGQDLTYLRSYLLGHLDGELDMFYYNFGNESGQFIKDGNQGKTFPKSNLKIEYNQISGTTSEWMITTSDGTIYTFAVQEDTYSANANNKTKFTSSWYLEHIQLTNGQEIDFIYDEGYSDVGDDDFDQQPIFIDEIITSPVPPFQACANPLGVSDISYASSLGRVYIQTLKRIDFPTGTILFNSTASRADIKRSSVTGTANLQPRGKRLNEIQVWNLQSKVHQIDLTYDYFTDDQRSKINTGGQHINMFNNGLIEEDRFRLRLDEVELDDKIYSFQYKNPDAIPSYYSLDQDIWGYPNTNKENGILTRINFPTGGYTDFEYEPNKYSNFANQFVNQTVYSLISNYD